MTVKFTDLEPVGPGTLAGRYLRHFWHPVYLAKDLPAKRAKPITILSENFTLYRGESGKPYIVQSKCAHRSTKLHTGWVRGENIRCLYHGWTYSGEGQCVEQPSEPQPFCDKVRIKSYPVQEYLGLIFAYFGEGAPPPLPRYPEVEESRMARAYVTVQDNCTWLNRYDNIGDVAHPYFAHPQIPGMNTDRAPQVRVQEKPYGILFYGDYPDGFSQETCLYMPNAISFPGARTGMKSVGWLVPIDDDHCVTFGVTEVFPILMDAVVGLTSVVELGEAILRGDMTVDDIMDHPAGVSIQDYVLLKAQGSAATRGVERLGRVDTGVIAVRKMWEREMTAFAEGKPPTHWDALR